MSRRSAPRGRLLLGGCLVAALGSLVLAVAIDPVWAVAASTFVLVGGLVIVLAEMRRVGRELSRAQRKLSSAEEGMRQEQLKQSRTLAKHTERLEGLRQRLSALRTTQIDARRRQRYELHAMRQVEALVDLRLLLQPRAPMPLSGGYAASPDLLHAVVHDALRRRPKLVVECGSGSSSVWLGYALERNGIGRVVSLEHDPLYAQLTRELVEEHGLGGIVEIRDAPLETWHLAGEEWPWYAKQALEDLDGIGLFIIDGPPAALRSKARYPAWPVLGPRLDDGAVAILDDSHRPDEKAVVEAWKEEVDQGGPAFESADLGFYKGAVRMTRRRAGLEH